MWRFSIATKQQIAGFPTIVKPLISNKNVQNCPESEQFREMLGVFYFQKQIRKPGAGKEVMQMPRMPKYLKREGRSFLEIAEGRNITRYAESAKGAASRASVPLLSYIGDDCSMNNANETRAEFNHLIAVAKDTGCAIVIIAHMNKAKDTSPLYHTNGSIDIAGAARSILAITRTANSANPAERYLVQVKSNLAPMGSAILFEVADKGVNFLDELEMTAEDAFAATAPRMGRPNNREEAATAFIRSMLDGGRQLASDCEAKLEGAGFKKSTYKKAKKKAGVHSVKDGFAWYWTLPEVEKPKESWQGENLPT